jgi:hypothetical protein
MSHVSLFHVPIVLTPLPLGGGDSRAKATRAGGSATHGGGLKLIAERNLATVGGEKGCCRWQSTGGLTDLARGGGKDP